MSTKHINQYKTGFGRKIYLGEGNRFSNKIFTIFVYLFVLAFAIICFLPFWLVVINSFASETSILRHGYMLIPETFSLNAYSFVLSGEQVFRSYGITLFVTFVGTTLAVLVTTTFAYVLAHPKVKIRNILSFMTYFTMIFGSGLVGFYMLIANWLHLKDSIWALILPYILNPFYVFILVSFFRTLPYEIYEAATIDGSNDIYTFFKIIWPISLPAIATVLLFYALQFWNDWWLALLFIDNYKLHPLQIMIRRLLSSIDAQNYVAGSGSSYKIAVPSQSLRLSIVCLTIGPIILLYPFVQKYFVKGMTIGAVKG